MAPLDPWKLTYRLDETLVFACLAFPNCVRKTVRQKIPKKADLAFFLVLILINFEFQNAFQNQVEQKSSDQHLDKLLFDLPGVARSPQLHQPGSEGRRDTPHAHRYQRRAPDPRLKEVRELLHRPHVSLEVAFKGEQLRANS